MAQRVRAAAKPGDNVTDETRMEALGECSATYAEVQELSDQLKTARSEHSNALKKWKGRGVVIEALKRAIKDRLLDTAEVLQELHEYTRLRALQNWPTIQQELVDLWTEIDIPDAQQEEIKRQRWHDDGSFAARNGTPRDGNQHPAGSEAFQAWDRGWLNNQERIAKAMGAGEAPVDTSRKRPARKGAANGSGDAAPKKEAARKKAAGGRRSSKPNVAAVGNA